MSYSFKTKLLGVEAEVEGVLDYGEEPSIDSWGEGREFEFKTITINDEAFEIECLSAETLEKLENAAFKAAFDEREH